VIFSLSAFFLGHFSYPRVHNLKVYLTGYLTGLTGIAYFLLFSIPQRTVNGIHVLMLLVFINFCVIIFLPSYIKYHITKRVTFLFVTVECALLIAARFYEPGIAWAGWLSRTGFFKVPSILAVVWFLDIFLISLFRLRDEFYLGGLFTGCALLYCAAWESPLFFTQKNAWAAEMVLFTSVTVYLEFGIFIHWLSRMEHRISYDPLLQIYNRQFCSKIIEEQSNIKTLPPLAVAMVDIDHFKKVNDTYGHQAGDRVLFTVAQIILREVIPDGIACRYGGEEIIIFFPNKRTRDIVAVLQNLRKAIEHTKIPWNKKKLSVTISVGVSHRDTAAQSIMDVINAADKALYKAKKGGRNQIKTTKTSISAIKQKERFYLPA
jgi:diguanylate cyclase (GGDEF)-like protein